MHFKRGRPKSARAGCLSCKPWKHQANKHMTAAQTGQERRARESELRGDDTRAPARKKKRVFAVEVRWVKGDGTLLSEKNRWHHGDWRFYGRYESEAARERAVSALNKKGAHPFAKDGRRREFRAAP